MLNKELPPALMQEIQLTAEELKLRFAQPEFIPGCQVMDVTDRSEYATNNGWVEAICGQHNRQRVRWKSNQTVGTASYIDVLYFPDRKIFEAYGLGGAVAVPAGQGWPFTNVLTVSTTDGDADYDNLTDAIAAADAGDYILIDAESSSETVTVDKAVTIISLARGGTIFTNRMTITAAARLYHIKITETAASAKGFVISAGAYLFDCEADVHGTSGVGTSRAVEISAGTVSIYGGYYEATSVGTPTEIFVSGGTCLLYNDPVLSGNQTSGTIRGTYSNGTADIQFATDTGLSGGMWIHRADGFRVKQGTSLATAVGNLSTGDTLVIHPGTYTLTTGSGGLEITDNNVTIIGIGEVTITSAQADVFTLDLRGDDITLQNLTINWTGTGSGGPIGTDGDNNRLINCKLNKTSGAATLSTGIWQYAGTGLVIQDCYISVTSGTSKYGYYNSLATASATIYGGQVGGTTGDIFGNESGSTLVLSSPILTNNIISYTGTKTGGYYSAGQLFLLPDREIGIAYRFTAGYTTIEDHFDGSALDSAWAWETGYGSFVTPGQVELGTIPSNLVLSQTTSSSGPKSFLKRTNNLTGALFGFGLVFNDPADQMYVGCRMDDGTDNNYVESLLRWASATNLVSLISRIRTGGGAVTTTVHFTLTDWPMYTIVRLQNVGTQWTNWSALGGWGIDGPNVQIATIGSGLTWTPTGRGLVFFRNSTSPTATFRGPYVDFEFRA